MWFLGCVLITLRCCCCCCCKLQGTMSHMAPEVLLNGHISKAADVYSFGITLWELFTGCHAYHGATSMAAAVLLIVVASLDSRDL
jgi:serine/threonine protein kinase